MHEFPLRIYYEDTDAGGIVYYANYLKFTERARTEFLRVLGFQNSTFIAENELFIVVRSLNADYIKPAVLDDVLNVKTRVHSLTAASFILHQMITKNDVLIFEMSVTLVMMNKQGRPQRLPQLLKEKFIEFLNQSE
jgi:acyl-CoA thioester hydrolase